MDRRSAREEVAHQIEHPITHPSDVDPDVLHVEALAQLLDLGGLVGE